MSMRWFVQAWNLLMTLKRYVILFFNRICSSSVIFSPSFSSTNRAFDHVTIYVALLRKMNPFFNVVEKEPDPSVEGLCNSRK